MPLEIVTVPCLSDNYAYLLRDAATGKVGLVDAPEPGPIEAALAARGWGLDLILITHHHADHIDGVDALRSRFGAKVVGAAADRRRLAGARHRAEAGRHGGARGERRARSSTCRATRSGTSPTTSRRRRPLFSADSLMVMGCGRLFEGSAEQMWQTPVDAGGAAGRHAGLFRARVHREQRPLRALGRHGEPGAAGARRGDRGDAEEGRARRCRRGSTSSGRRTRSCAPRTRSSRRGWGWKICPMPKFSPRSAGARTAF